MRVRAAFNNEEGMADRIVEGAGRQLIWKALECSFASGVRTSLLAVDIYVHIWFLASAASLCHKLRRISSDPLIFKRVAYKGRRQHRPSLFS
jgi:hypothetical protein